MHRSRLGTLVIDCRTADLDADTAFWSRALGLPVQRRPGEERYRGLATDPTQPKVLLQAVDHPSRVHLDIETDDVAAEVARLERLGATRIEQVRDWWVMEAPSGHRFCVVPPQRPDFESAANEWSDDDQGEGA